MKILAVGRNYVGHVKELANEMPEEPVIFSKPSTSLLINNAPFYYPDFSKEIHYEVEIVVKIAKVGKNIRPEFATNYYHEIALGVDLTARDIQSNLKKKGLPWDLAKGFDGAAPISRFLSKEAFDLSNLPFSLLVNGQLRQGGNTSLMIYSIDHLIAFLSTYFTLQVGDLIFTGTPQGVGPVQIGDQLQGFIQDIELFNFAIA